MNKNRQEPTAKSQQLKANSHSSIPYGRQHITQQDIDAVVEVLKSDFLTQGPKVKEFEEKFAEYVGAKYAVAASNGTAALHLCNLALGVKSGDMVITSPITFVASANSVLYCGGEIDFVDIDPATYTIDLDKLEEKLASSPKGTYKGVIPVDLAGYPVDVERLRKIADKYGLWIIEDACHAPGGYFTDSKGIKQYCGNGAYSDLQIFSFHPVKHIATGEGGMITTNNKELYKKLQTLRTHGITKDTESFQNSMETAYGNSSMTIKDEPRSGINDSMTKNDVRSANDIMTTNDGQRPNDFPDWYYEMQHLGFNYRLSDIHAALGVSQLKRADEGLKRRREIAEKYNENFIDKPYILGQSGVVEGHAYHLYVIEVKNRRGLYEHLRKNNIFAQIHYVPVHLMPYYKQFGWKEGDLPQAEAYYSRCISLPMFPTLTNEEQKFVINCINNFYNNQ